METKLMYRLDDFEGPLDLLLQLISKNKLNIYDIKLSVLIDQYLEQIECFRRQELEIASEFLEMSSRLIYMKTVSLLPRHEEIERLKEELTGELLEYSICREMAGKLSEMTDGFDKFVKPPTAYDFDSAYELTHESETLVNAYLSAVNRAKRFAPVSVAPFTRIVAKKIVSVSTKIVYVIRKLAFSGKTRLSSLYKEAKSRSELVATFLAVLELCKANRVKIGASDMADAEIKLVKGHKRNEQ
ncbi:MAG: segregation/condensation protein A [Clostridia bacterium]|nr:segregation/condensation protein A [Clostridia bacterium]